jgi:hypothetical protein
MDLNIVTETVCCSDSGNSQYSRCVKGYGLGWFGCWVMAVG